MEITPTLSIPDNEFTFTFLRASGPGGQNVNKVASSVQLRFDVRNSPSLHGQVKDRLAKLAGARMTQEGVLVIEANRYRTQERNRSDALERLSALIEKATRRPRIRRATRPSLAARAKRVDSKKRRATLKKQRQSVDE
jgi:ribosome-associated protein